MLYLARQLIRLETEADKEEFLRGVASLDKESGKKKIITGLISGALLARGLKK